MVINSSKSIIPSPLPEKGCSCKVQYAFHCRILFFGCFVLLSFGPSCYQLLPSSPQLLWCPSASSTSLLWSTWFGWLKTWPTRKKTADPVKTPPMFFPGLFQLLSRDVSIAVSVKDSECRPTNVLLHVLLPIKKKKEWEISEKIHVNDIQTQIVSSSLGDSLEMSNLDKRYIDWNHHACQGWLRGILCSQSHHCHLHLHLCQVQTAGFLCNTHKQHQLVWVLWINMARSRPSMIAARSGGISFRPAFPRPSFNSACLICHHSQSSGPKLLTHTGAGRNVFFTKRELHWVHVFIHSISFFFYFQRHKHLSTLL